MITSTIILVLLYILQQAVNVLPTGNLPTEVYTAFQTVLDQLAGWQQLIPVDDLLTVLQATVAFQAVVWLFKLIVWVYGRIRGVSGK